MYAIVDWSDTQLIGPFKTKEEAEQYLRAKYNLLSDITDYELSILELKTPGSNEAHIRGLEDIP